MNTNNTNFKNNYFVKQILNLVSIMIQIFDNFKERIIQYAPNVSKDEVIFFDFETTGLNPYHEKIIEYCFMVDDEDSNTYITDIVNPNQKIDKKITDITGIHPDMFEGKTSIEHHIHTIYDFINGTTSNSIFNVKRKYMVAHNAIGFDSIFLNKELNVLKQRNNNIVTNNIVYLDTLLLAKKLFPNMNSYSLASLAKYFDVNTGNHRAHSDVECLKNVYNHLLTELSKKTRLPTSYYKECPQEVVDYYKF